MSNSLESSNNQLRAPEQDRKLIDHHSHSVSKSKRVLPIIARSINKDTFNREWRKHLFKNHTTIYSRLDANLNDLIAPQKAKRDANTRLRLALKRIKFTSNSKLMTFADAYTYTKVLRPSLNHYKNLTTVDLRLPEYPMNTDRSIEGLATQLKYLPFLSTIAVHFINSNPYNSHNITNGGVQKLSSSLKYHTRLSHLSLAFIRCPKIDDVSIKNLSISLRRICHLSSLSLQFSGDNQLTDRAFYHLSLGLLSQRSLLTLNLNFTSCKGLTSKGVESLSIGLGHLTSLRELTILFGYNQITDLDIETLAISLQSISSLTALKLDFFNCEALTDNGLENLSHSLRQLTSLSSLALYFSYCHQLTDKGVQTLSASFEELVSLSSIELGFSTCVEISNRSIKNIFLSCKDLVSLSNLKLSLFECYQVKKAEVPTLSRKLKHLPSLSQMVFNGVVVTI